jgi:hypothetical protein
MNTIQVKKSNDHFGNGTRNLPACIIVPEQTTVQSPPKSGRIAAKGADKETDVRSEQ